MDEVIAVPEIQQRIHRVRGKRVIMDADLAHFYGVTAKVINRAVSRNLDRFPEDFSFRLTLTETENLRSQSVTSRLQHGGSRYVNRVFTEQGVAMLASVLRSRPGLLPFRNGSSYW